MESETDIQTDDIKFAVFDGSKEITDEMYDEVKKFAAFIRQQDGNSK